MTIDIDAPEVQTAITEAVAEQTEGLAANKQAILDEKKAVEAEFKTLKEAWGELDPAVVVPFMTKISEDEALSSIINDGVDAFIEKRTGLANEAHETQMTALTSRLGELVVEQHVRNAAETSGMVKSAVPDAVARAATLFNVDAEGIVTPKADDGPADVATWLDGMKAGAPHWFPVAKGAPLRGGQPDQISTFTITRAESRDASKYQAAKAAAEKAGQQVMIVE